MNLKEIFEKNRYLTYGLVFVIIFLIFTRIYFLPHLGFDGDFQIFKGWGLNLKAFGISQFYQNTACNYFPIYVYLLKFSNSIQPAIHHLNYGWSADQVIEISYKIPTFLADLLTGYFIFIFIRRATNNLNFSLLGLFFYLAHPALLHNTYFYGQNNVLLFAPTVALLYFLYFKKYIFAGLALAILLLIKPTGIILLPFLIFYLALTVKKDYMKYLEFVLAFYLLLQLLILPFYFRLPWDFAKLFKESLLAGNPYKVTTMYAYNFWYLITGGDPIKDATKFLGQSYQFWGLLLFYLSYLLTLIVLYLKKMKYTLLAVTAILFFFFIFPTRVHEGYLLFAFPIFTLTIFIETNILSLILYFVSSVAYSINLWSYWPVGFTKNLPLHYANRLSTPSALIIVATPFLLLLATFIIKEYKMKKPNL